MKNYCHETTKLVNCTPKSADSFRLNEGLFFFLSVNETIMLKSVARNMYSIEFTTHPVFVVVLDQIDRRRECERGWLCFSTRGPGMYPTLISRLLGLSSAKSAVEVTHINATFPKLFFLATIF